jgi:hypothetical protein
MMEPVTEMERAWEELLPARKRVELERFQQVILKDVLPEVSHGQMFHWEKSVTDNQECAMAMELVRCTTSPQQRPMMETWEVFLGRVQNVIVTVIRRQEFLTKPSFLIVTWMTPVDSGRRMEPTGQMQRMDWDIEIPPFLLEEESRYGDKI